MYLCGSVVKNILHKIGAKALPQSHRWHRGTQRYTGVWSRWVVAGILSVVYIGNMKQLTAALLGCYCCLSAMGQTITSVEYVVNWQNAGNPVPVAGKGVYMLLKDGIVLFDPLTRKYSLYNQNESGSAIGGFTGLTVNGNRVIAHTAYQLHELVNNKLRSYGPTGLSGLNDIKHISVNDNGLVVTSKTNVYKLSAGWNQVSITPVQGGSQTAAITKVFPGANNTYFITREKSAPLVHYTVAAKTAEPIADAGDYPILTTSKALWLLTDKSISYTSLAKKTSARIPAAEYPGNLQAQLLSEGKSFRDCRLVLNENQEVFFIGPDSALKLSTNPINDSMVSISLQKATLPEIAMKKDAGYFIYKNVLYETGADGIIAHRSAKKRDTVMRVTNRIIALEGYNRMMPNGFLYTRDKQFVHWNNGKIRGTSRELSGWVLGIASDGKTNYVLTEKNLYKERSMGVFDTIANIAANKMKALAIEKNGNIWMAGSSGITSIIKGKTEFIPASEIQGFPSGLAVQSLAISPEGELFVNFNYVYKYKDKAMTQVPDSKYLIYTNNFDGKGNDYWGGLGDYLYYDGKSVTKIDKILKDAYPQKDAPYPLHFSVDELGRCWVLTNFRTHSAIVVLDQGKPIQLINDNRLALYERNQKIFAQKGQFIIATEKGGWAIVKYQ